MRSSLWVDPGQVGLPPGRVYSAPPDPATVPQRRARRLSSTAVRRTLRPVPAIRRDWTLVIHTDLSGSMTGGNDAAGLRHEALLIVAEHLASRRRTGGRSWHLRVHSFDDGGTCLDLPRTPIDRRRLRELEAVLLGETYGGSSNLGPSLDTSIAESAGWGGGGIVRMVLSDFELFDADVPAVLRRFEQAPADLNGALVFRSPVPPALSAGTVRTHHVDPAVDAPETVAALVTDALVSTVEQLRA